MKKIILSSLLMGLSITMAMWLYVSTTVTGGHSLMRSVWAMPQDVERVLNHSLDKYVAVSLSENIYDFDVMRKIRFWSILSEVDEFSVRSKQREIVVVSRFDLYFTVEAYESALDLIGFSSVLGGEHVFIMYAAEHKECLVFVPFDHPRYVLSFSNKSLCTEASNAR